MSGYEKTVSEHYAKQAREVGLSPLSTTPDEVVREREIDAIIRYVALVDAAMARPLDLLEVGCGNGYTLGQLRERFPTSTLQGVDYSPEMIAISRSRGVERARFDVGDVRALSCEPNAFDIVLSERCVINLLDREHQLSALREIHRVVRPGGVCILIEGFEEGLDALNRARAEFDLSPIPMPFHNLFFDEAWFKATIEDLFVEPAYADDTLPKANFLSSHYFMSRVVHAALSRKDVRNSEFVRFFSFLPPVGNYASVQLRVLEKLGP